MQGSQYSVPVLSLTERNRRYRLVRREMAKAGIDILIASPNTSRWEQMMADSRYLTGIGGFATETLTLLPLQGAPTAYVFNRADWWRGAQNWVRDVRDGRNRWSANAIERLNEIGFRRGRIGLSGLEGLVRAPDGTLSHRFVERLQQAFPGAKLVDATSMMQTVRGVKSDEEIAALERSMAIIELMLARVRRLAKPGVPERDVYAGLVETLVREGGELPSMLLFGAGPSLRHGHFYPTARRLRRGDLIVGEIEARVAGYSAQAVQPIKLGRPSAEERALHEVALACFKAVTAAMKPGARLGQLMDEYTSAVEHAGKSGQFTWAHPMMHARGMGDELPALLGAQDLKRFRDVMLQPGMTFVVKPRVANRRTGRSAAIGETVVVTKTGVRRLGRRRLGLESLE